MDGYWSGSVGGLGGELLLGALPRIKRNGRMRDALWMAIGLAILANSRPYEGLILSLPVLVDMLIWLFRDRGSPVMSRWLRVVLPMTIVLGLSAVATGYYYHRVTGRAFRMAYVVNRSQYAIAPYFLWQKPHPEPAYRHAEMRDLYEWEFQLYQRNITPLAFLQRSYEQMSLWWAFYLGPLF